MHTHGGTKLSLRLHCQANLSPTVSLSVHLINTGPQFAENYVHVWGGWEREGCEQKMSSSVSLIPSWKCLLCCSQETHITLEKDMDQLHLQTGRFMGVSRRPLSALSLLLTGKRVRVRVRAHAFSGTKN